PGRPYAVPRRIDRSEAGDSLARVAPRRVARWFSEAGGVGRYMAPRFRSTLQCGEGRVTAGSNPSRFAASRASRWDEALMTMSPSCPEPRQRPVKWNRFEPEIPIHF